MGRHNAAARRYLREIKKSLPCGRKEKKSILCAIQTAIEDFLCENPKAGFAEIVERIGNPKQVAVSYVEEAETSQLLGDLRIRKRIFTSVVATAAVMITLWLGFLAVCYLNVEKDADGYTIVEVIEIERIEAAEGGQ